VRLEHLLRVEHVQVHLRAAQIDVRLDQVADVVDAAIIAPEAGVELDLHR